MAVKSARQIFFQIDSERDINIRKWFLVFLTLLILLIGMFAESSGIEGAVVASTGVVVAVTTPLFAIFLGQMADYSVGVRLVLFNFRSEKSFGDAVGLVSFSEEGKQKEREAMSQVVEKIDEFSKVEASVRKSSNSLISVQSWVVAASALIASFAGYAHHLFLCGAFTC